MLTPVRNRRLRLAGLFLVTVAFLGAPEGVAAQLASDGRPAATGDDGRVRLIRGLRVETPGGDPEARARWALARRAADIDADGLDLRAERVLRAHGTIVVRFRRHALGLPMPGGYVVVRMDQDGVVDVVHGHPGPRALDHAPRALEDGRAAALARAAVRWPRAEVRVIRDVALDLGDRAARGVEVELFGGLGRRARVRLDARDGSVHAIDDLVTHARARVYDTNPVTGGGETTEVELDHLESETALSGTYVEAGSCSPLRAGCDVVQAASADAMGDFLYEPDEPSFEDPFSEVMAYFHADRAAAYFRAAHGYTWSCCGRGVRMSVVANYHEVPEQPYDNAFYSGTSCAGSECGSIALGQGRRADFGYDGEVTYHEYGHGVVDDTAGIAGFQLDSLGVGYLPGGVNEGTADYFSATIAGDPDMAEYFSGTSGLGTVGEASLRDLDNDLRCPDDLFGEAHADGRIWAGTVWDLREGFGRELADRLMFGALIAMGDDATFDTGGELLYATAEVLLARGEITVEQLRRVGDVIDARGLRGCRRIVPLRSGRPHSGYSGTEFATGTLGQSIAPLHHSIAIPADATRLTLQIRHRTVAGRYSLFVRDSEPLRFNVARRPPLLHDAAFEGFTEVVLEADGGAHPLPRCDTLYMALRVDDLTSAGQSIYEIVAELERSGDPDARCPDAPDAGPPELDAGPQVDAGAPDAGHAPPSVRGGGCAAAGAGGAPPLLPWLWLYSPVAVRRMTRSTRRDGTSK